MQPKLVAVALAAIVVALVSGCGSSHRAARLGLKECVEAWNRPDNATRRERVANSVVRAGYTRPGLQLSITLGRPMVSDKAEPNPNPVGCRVIFFKHDQWIAFVAHRVQDHFRFRRVKAGLEQGDQSGVWPNADLRGPNNAALLSGARLAVGPYVVNKAEGASWKALINDWFADGHIDGRYSCSVARQAVAHLPVDGPEIGASVRAYERKVC